MIDAERENVVFGGVYEAPENVRAGKPHSITGYPHTLLFHARESVGHP
jgi:hypothetical protein